MLTYRDVKTLPCYALRPVSVLVRWTAPGTLRPAAFCRSDHMFVRPANVVKNIISGDGGLWGRGELQELKEDRNTEFSDNY